MHKKYLIGLIFLLAQLLSIFYARIIPEKFFCWAPYDEHTYYKVFVKIENIELTTDQIQERYHYEANGWEPRTISNLINIINQYENTYGKFENASVKIKYAINGKPEKIWIKN